MARRLATRTTPGTRFRRRIAPPALDSVARIGAALDAWARAVGLSDERRRELLLACDELASNVANHARGATELRVEARRLASGGARLRVEDDGARFDPLARRRPRTDQVLAERAVGGLGILLVRELAASVEHEFRSGRNRVRVDLRP